MTTSIVIAGIIVLFLSATIFYNSKLSVDQKHTDIKEEDHWYGPININPQDERPFLPKHYGGGFTVNFGNVLGVLTAIGFLLLIGWVIYVSG